MPHTEAGLATARLSNQQESTGGVGLSEGLAPAPQRSAALAEVGWGVRAQPCPAGRYETVSWWK